MPNETDAVEKEKALLIEKRNELRERLESIKKDYRQGLDSDSEERAIQLENADVLAGIAKSAAEELERIEERLAALS